MVAVVVVALVVLDQLFIHRVQHQGHHSLCEPQAWYAPAWNQLYDASCYVDDVDDNISISLPGEKKNSTGSLMIHHGHGSNEKEDDGDIKR